VRVQRDLISNFFWILAQSVIFGAVARLAHLVKERASTEWPIGGVKFMAQLGGVGREGGLDVPQGC
jgi:hypothetical protein